MKFAIVGHPQRARQALDLTHHLNGVLFMDTKGRGAYDNHRRALTWAATQTERVTIVEDDALPVPNAATLADMWAREHPDDLISFYLGTTHPTHWQAQVDKVWDNEDETVTLPQLVHGVGYSIPPHMVQAVLDAMRPGPVDYSIGTAWATLTRRPIIYPKRSLFDHEDGPSIIQATTPRTPRGPRKARALHT